MRLAVGIGLWLAMVLALHPAAHSVEQKGTPQATAPALEPELRSLRSVLERELANLRPAPTFAATYGSHSLLVAHRTREYQVYPRDRRGRIGNELIRTNGPGDEGFLLRVYLEDSGQIGAAVVPQTYHEPYWSTFLNVHALAATDKQIRIALSYRGTTSPTLVEKIKKTLERQSQDNREK
jgi:hypothetical protein